MAFESNFYGALEVPTSVIPKLFQWLIVLFLYLSIWIAVVTRKIDVQNSLSHDLVFFSPFILVVLFGVYSVVVLSYRVATFNTCTEAAEELKKEIEAAKSDLRKKGLKIN